MALSPGQKLRLALDEERPLQIVGTIHALSALIASKQGFRAIYLSGAGVANASHGLPDLGVTNLCDVVEDARRITAAVDLPLLVDADTGWGSTLNIARTVSEFIRAGVAGMHLEDQVEAKRCGHRPGKQLVVVDEMLDRIKAAVDARTDSSFQIMARTDAAAVEGIDLAIERSLRYVEHGADMIFAEALTSLEEFQRFTSQVHVPVLANITEFGKTPLFGVEDLASVGVRMVLYPLTAFRAMNKAASRVYEAIRRDGSQRSMIDQMQTRDELYDLLGYHALERRVDQENRKSETSP